MVDRCFRWNNVQTVAAPDELLRPLSYRSGICLDDRNPFHYSNWRRRVWVLACRQVALEGFSSRCSERRMQPCGRPAVDVKTVQTWIEHRIATTTFDVYAQPTSAADCLAADVVGNFILADSEVPPDAMSSNTVARDTRAMDTSRRVELHLAQGEARLPLTRGYSVGVARIELATSALSVLRSNRLSYTPGWNFAPSHYLRSHSCPS
jgi:hypothetical protein